MIHGCFYEWGKVDLMQRYMCVSSYASITIEKYNSKNNFTMWMLTVNVSE